MSETVTDAEWAAREAIAALQEGRYRLGASLAHLAMRAHQQETNGAPDGPADIRSVPLIGSTRDEQPARPAPAPVPLYEDLAQTTRLQAVPDEVGQQYAPETARCRWTDKIPGDFCWQAIYVDAGMWHHVDPEWDKAHPATPTPPGDRL